jgi:hypothetical protein
MFGESSEHSQSVAAARTNDATGKLLNQFASEKTMPTWQEMQKTIMQDRDERKSRTDRQDRSCTN